MKTPNIKLLVKHLLGKDLYLSAETSVETDYFGTRYGGWATPADAVLEDSVVYSFGIGEDASWDLALIDTKGCKIHGFDPTPKSLEWVEKHVTEPHFVMHPQALADFDGSLDLWLPANPEHVSASLRQSSGTSHQKITVPCEKLSTTMKRLGHERIDVLKMDIEGAEYAVLRNLCAEEGLLTRIGVLLVEFHHWMPAFDRHDTRESLSLLREGGFVPGWVSETGHEVMFVRP